MNVKSHKVGAACVLKKPVSFSIYMVVEIEELRGEIVLVYHFNAALKDISPLCTPVKTSVEIKELCWR